LGDGGESQPLMISNRLETFIHLNSNPRLTLPAAP
jgi:hypothetical protein